MMMCRRLARLISGTFHPGRQYLLGNKARRSSLKITGSYQLTTSGRNRKLPMLHALGTD